MDESTTFETTSTLAPRRAASRMASDVSSVSPDCDTPTQSVRSLSTGSRYRNSLAMSTSVGSFTQCSMANLATNAAW